MRFNRFQDTGNGAELRWIRPLHSIVCLLGGKVVPFEIAGIEAGKHVFVEKPLCLTQAELNEILGAYDGSRLLMVGFNRRFAPLAQKIKAMLGGRTTPLMMTYRVNAGALPPGHWLNDPEIGGGRLIGEGCHFVDLCSYMTGDAAIASVETRQAGRPTGPSEDFVIQLSFADGSLAQILYTAKGNSRLAKERFEAHAGGISAVLDDYTSGAIHRGGKVAKLARPGKGHAEEIDALLRAVREGRWPRRSST